MAEMDSGGGSQGARCALHPTLGAAGTCQRCGNFMCVACNQHGASTFCPACREREDHGAFPLRRDTWNFSALWSYCFEAFKREWVMLSVAMLVAMGVGLAAQLLGNLVGAVAQVTDSVALVAVFGLVAFLGQIAVQGVMGMGMQRVVLDVLEGRRADIGRLFSQMGKVGRYLGAVLLALVLLGLPLLLLFSVLSFVGLVAGGLSVGEIVGGGAFRSEQVLTPLVLVGAFLVTLGVGLYFGLPLYLLQTELAFEEDTSAVETLRHCYTLARGERLSILGVTLVAALVGLVGVLACCVGIIPALALGQLLVGGLYLSLRTGAEP